MSSEKKIEELDFNDPRVMAADPKVYPMSFAYMHTPDFGGQFEDIAFGVEAWNPLSEGGTCFYGMPHGSTWDDALAYARKLRAEGDPSQDGRKYRNYDLVEMVYEVRITTTVHDVPQEAEVA